MTSPISITASHTKTSSSAATPKVTGTVRSKNPLKGAVEILPERLYYAALSKLPPSHNILATIPKRDKSPPASSGKNTTTDEVMATKKQIHFFCIDNELVYWNFFLDFGPLNLGQLTRFCKKLNDKLRKFPVVCFYSCTDNSKRANAIFLICIWQMLYLDRTPEQSYAGFEKHVLDEIMARNKSNLYNVDASKPPISVSQGAPTIAALPNFHDASPCPCTYDLTVLDCLKGFAKARMHGFFDLETFDVEEYEYFEQVENGDLNWLVKDKILAFAGPSFERYVSPEGYCTLAPADYIPYFQQKNVSLVVRLNKKCYNEQDFVDAGIDHVEAYFTDGSCPSMEILHGVIDAFEQVPDGKAFAVHCKAGLGRTGTCIGAYLMKHYGFTAKEAISWMRICRPGCVIGPQQQFLEKIQQMMWDEGVAAGYIEMPHQDKKDRMYRDESQTCSPTSMTTIDDSDMPDAITGRAGQADGLLAARVGRASISNKSSSPSTSPTITDSNNSKQRSTPVTPESRAKISVAVTPEASPKPSMWCG